MEYSPYFPYGGSIVKRIFVTALLIVACCGLAMAAPKGGSSRKAPQGPKPAIPAEGMAFGVFLGQPTGFTFRIGVASTQSMEFKAAWSLGSSQAAFSAEGNWLIEFPNTIVIEREQFIPYTGIGASLGVGSGELGLGFRVPGGIVYRFESAPIELCLEIGLGMSIIPATAFNATGGLGVRYRF